MLSFYLFKFIVPYTTEWLVIKFIYYIYQTLTTKQRKIALIEVLSNFNPLFHYVAYVQHTQMSMLFIQWDLKKQF